MECQKDFIERLLKEISVQKELVTKNFSTLKTEEFNWSKDQGWTVAQCFEHLNSYGRYYLPKIHSGISKCGNTGKASDLFHSTFTGRIRSYIMHPETGRIRFKAFKFHTPPSLLEGKLVVNEFLQQLTMLQEYLSFAENKKMDSITIPVSQIPFFKINAGDAFNFLIVHNQRHILQAVNILRFRSKISDAIATS